MKYLIKRCKVAVFSIAIASVMTGVVSPLVAPEIALATGSGLYSVYQDRQCLGAYSSRDVAIREAKKWSNSEVKQNGSVIWAFTDTLYKVYQGSQCLGAYSSKDVAIREAGKWSNSEVKQNGGVVWTFGSSSSSNTGLNDGLYRVYQGGQCLGAYSSKDVAIREASKWSGSSVKINGNTAWNFTSRVISPSDAKSILLRAEGIDLRYIDVEYFPSMDVMYLGTRYYCFETMYKGHTGSPNYYSVSSKDGTVIEGILTP